MIRNARLNTMLALSLGAGTVFGFGLYVGSGSAGTSEAVGFEVLTVQEGMGEMDPEAMMEMYAQAGQPGEQHEEMKVFVGTWKADLKSMMAGMEDFNTTGTATYKPIMGGRFLHMDFKSTIMGEPMNGMNLTGYHKALKRYESIWIDDTGTALNYMTGKKTDDGWVYDGEETDPIAGQTLPVRDTIVMDGKDKFTFTRHYPAEAAAAMGIEVAEGQDWVPGFQIVYTRAGGDHGDGHDGDHGGNRGGNSGNRPNRR